jgi:hypothetical protein
MRPKLKPYFTFLIFFFVSSLTNGAVHINLYPAHKIDRVIEYARQYENVPYNFGGCTRSGIDCSCLMQNIFQNEGIDIPRNSRAQANFWRGEDVSIENIQRGDLIFFRTEDWYIGHVGLISSVTDFVMFIHSSSESDYYGGDTGVRESYLTGKWIDKFVKGKRFFETLSRQKPSIGSIAYHFPGKYPQSSNTQLKKDELVKLGNWELRIMLNEIFARHGYEFNKNSKIMSYFNSQDWYVKTPKVSRNGAIIYNNYLSGTEKDNILLIKNTIKDFSDIPSQDYLPGKHPQGSTMKLTLNDIKKATQSDQWKLKVMRNEIFARHGYVFRSDKIGNYFKNQPWYDSRILDEKFNFYHYYLTKIEKFNIAQIRTIELKENCFQINYHGKYPSTSRKKLTIDEIVKLTGSNKNELRIMRNEIFARHGYKFKTQEMRYYFEKQAWIKPCLKLRTPIFVCLTLKNVIYH